MPIPEVIFGSVVAVCLTTLLVFALRYIVKTDVYTERKDDQPMWTTKTTKTTEPKDKGGAK